MNWVRSVVSWIQTIQKLQIIDGTYPVVFTPQKLANSAPDDADDARNIARTDCLIDLTLSGYHAHRISSKEGRIKSSGEGHIHNFKFRMCS